MRLSWRAYGKAEQAIMINVDGLRGVYYGGANRNYDNASWLTIGADGRDGPCFRRRCDAKRWVECAAAGMSQAPRIERAARHG